MIAKPRVIPALPRKLWIGSYEFMVRTVPADDPVLEGQDGDMAASDAGYAITLSNNLDTRRKFEIVIHEITHAINWGQDIGDSTDEETIATKHGWAWSQFYLDNPRFMPWVAYTIDVIRKEQKKGGG